MKGWNPFGKVDMEIGSFLEKSPFNKEYPMKGKINKKDESQGKQNKE